MASFTSFLKTWLHSSLSHIVSKRCVFNNVTSKAYKLYHKIGMSYKSIMEISFLYFRKTVIFQKYIFYLLINHLLLLITLKRSLLVFYAKFF